MRFPMQWLGEIADGHIERLTIGESGAAVFRIRRAYGGGPVHHNPSPSTKFAELPGEIDRLRWLASRDLPAPARCWTLSSNTNVIGCWMSGDCGP